MTTRARLRTLAAHWPAMSADLRREVIVRHGDVYRAAVRLAKRERRSS